MLVWAWVQAIFSGYDMPSEKLTIEWATGDPKLLEITESAYIVTALVADWSLNYVENRLPEGSTINILVGIHLPCNIKILDNWYGRPRQKY